MTKIALLTDFQKWNSGYSLCGVVQDQCRMLKRYGHEVILLVNENFEGECPVDAEVRKVIPFCKQIDYKTENDLTGGHLSYSKVLAKVLIKELSEFKVCIAHDRIFLGWALPYMLALEECKEQTRHCLFLHWIHSMPRGIGNQDTGRFDACDWWDLNRLGNNHKIVVMAKYTQELAATNYKTSIDNVLVIPHIKDLRTFADFSEETCDIIDKVPLIMQADVVCVYPAATDRLAPKRVAINLVLMSYFKIMNIRPCFIVANQWAKGVTEREHKEDNIPIDKVLERHKILGSVDLDPPLIYGDEFIFTSDLFYPKYKNGLPKRVLRELMMCSNLFIFPTSEESFGLVAPEAALLGNYIVLNQDVEVLHNVFNNEGHYESFGSFSNRLPIDPIHYHAVAKKIVRRMFSDRAIRTRTSIRQNLNYDKIYLRHYQPLLKEM